jgi:hypothetical protein
MQIHELSENLLMIYYIINKQYRCFGRVPLAKEIVPGTGILGSYKMKQ